MTVKRNGLGRNLSALLGSSNTIAVATADKVTSSNELTLTASQLTPGRYQPRANFDESTLSELAESIKKQGLLQPLIVRQLSDGHYEIIAGERRWRACQLAGLDSIPVILHEVDDETAMAMALVENLQREDLNAMDQARAMHRLTIEFNLTHQQIATLLSKSRTAVSNFLRLLNLHSQVRLLLENGDIEMGHARCLLSLDEDQQIQVAQLVVAKNLSVRETEAIVSRIKSGVPPSAAQSIQSPSIYDDLIHHLSKQLQTKVKLKPGASGKGSLVIHYQNEHTLKKMLQQLLE